MLERLETRAIPRPEIRITYRELPDGTGIELLWMGDAGRSYRVARSMNRLDEFITIGMPMIGRSELLRYPVPFSAGEQAGFFRVQSLLLEF